MQALLENGDIYEAIISEFGMDDMTGVALGAGRDSFNIISRVRPAYLCVRQVIDQMLNSASRPYEA
jgi:hypothetical protein